MESPKDFSKQYLRNTKPTDPAQVQLAARKAEEAKRVFKIISRVRRRELRDELVQWCINARQSVQMDPSSSAEFAVKLLRVPFEEQFDDEAATFADRTLYFLVFGEEDPGERDVGYEI